jgi:tetratricopeptide (TPR) repeat protein
MTSMDEHVLERISSLEYALSVMNKRVDGLTESMERIAANNFIDHTMIETLTESLESAGVNLANLESEWQKRIDSRLTENEEVDRLGSRMEQIIDFYRGSQRKQFTLWVERAYDLLVSDHTEESQSSLESAFKHDPSNYELGMLLAEVFFQSKEFSAASQCLAQVLKTKPDHFEATLLMGLLEKRNGNLHKARQLLEAAVGMRNDSASAHATLGSLFLDHGDREQALGHLERALELRPSAPIHFMISAIYYDGNEHRRAIDHLKQATQLDPEYGEAFYQMGLLCQEINWRRKAKECFRNAQRINPREQRYHQEMRGFSECHLSPDELGGLVRDELRLAGCWSPKRSK